MENRKMLGASGVLSKLQLNSLPYFNVLKSIAAWSQASLFTGIIIFLIALSFTPRIQAQTAPLCDVTCVPDGGSSNYGAVAGARPLLLNARGHSRPTAAKIQTPELSGKALAANANETVIGSQSYNYTIPILHLPGRAGMDLTLNLYYNSRIWDIDTTGATATFNADRDFPSYGFRLDYGFVEYLSGADVYVMTEADGSKHPLPNSGQLRLQ